MFAIKIISKIPANKCINIIFTNYFKYRHDDSLLTDLDLILYYYTRNNWP